MLRLLLPSLLLACALPLSAQGAVVINEFCYDDSGTDDHEYVELYNTTNSDINIGGWVLAAQDANGPDRSFTIPASTTIKAGEFYVIGSPLVPNVDLVSTVATNIWQNSNEDLALIDNNNNLIDAVMYEANKGYFTGARLEGEAIWGNFTGIQQSGIYTGILIGNNVVPAVSSKGYGRAIVKYDSTTRAFDVRVEATGILLPVGANFRLGKKGANGASILGLTGSGNVWTGSGILTAAQDVAFLAGECYVELLSAVFPNGEIRGQALPLPTTSWSRTNDGVDTNNNGKDFALMPSTPGMSNNPIGPALPYTNNFDAIAVETQLPEWPGSFTDGTVVDPTTVSTYNPNTIVASPQGGRAIAFWDPAGGGNSNKLLVDSGDANIVLECYVYIDPTLAPTGENTTWSIGIGGTVGTYYNTPDPSGTLGFTANHNTGLAWTYQQLDSSVKMYLVDHGDGGWGGNAVSGPTVLGSVTVTSTSNAGWQRMRLEINGDHFSGSLGGTFGCADGNTFSGKLKAGAPTGTGVYIGFREGLSLNGNARPVTIDRIEVKASNSEISHFGTAKATTVDTPVIDAMGTPTIGNASFSLELSKLVPNSSGFLVLGTAKRGTPLDMATIGGQSGSFLYVTTDVLTGIANGTAGEFSLPIAIPCQTALVGASAFWQHFDVDQSLTVATKLGNTDAMEMKVGGN